jgi:hypothetical protein
MIALLALALGDDVEALARADDALARCHAVANGVVTMRWNVRRGTVVQLASDGDPGLGVCVGDRIRAWRFEDDGAYTHTFVVPDRATVTVLPSGRDSSTRSGCGATRRYGAAASRSGDQWRPRSWMVGGRSPFARLRSQASSRRR